jgi:DNA-binding NarL/FixJ family response regulator
MSDLLAFAPGVRRLNMTDLKQTAPAENNHFRVLLADCSPVECKGLRRELLQLPFVKIVGEAHTSDATLAICFRSQPHVVVLSALLPDLGGFEVLRCIKRASAESLVILRTQSSNEFIEQAATLLGASGVCLAGDGFAPVSELIQELWICRSSGNNH